MTDTRSELERMRAGEPYYQPDKQIGELRDQGRARLQAFNDTPITDFPRRVAAISAMLGRPSHCWIESPFFLEYGIHVEIGDFTFINANCTFLDSNRITIGSHVLIGTGVQLLASGHPGLPEDRWVSYPEHGKFPFRGVALARPISIGDDCWIGAGTIVLGGVSIGSRTTIGAGSVVTRSIPANVVAVGSPCRVIREIGPSDPDAKRTPPRPHSRAGWPDIDIGRPT